MQDWQNVFNAVENTEKQRENHDLEGAVQASKGKKKKKDFCYKATHREAAKCCIHVTILSSVLACGGVHFIFGEYPKYP